MPKRHSTTNAVAQNPEQPMTVGKIEPLRGMAAQPGYMFFLKALAVYCGCGASLTQVSAAASSGLWHFDNGCEHSNKTFKPFTVRLEEK